jgi:hypothetical protein
MLQHHATFGVPELVRYFTVGGRVPRYGSLIRYLRLADPFSVSGAVNLRACLFLHLLNLLGPGRRGHREAGRLAKIPDIPYRNPNYPKLRYPILNSDNNFNYPKLV